MVDTYRKIIEFQNLVTDRLQQENITLNKIKDVLYQEKEFIIISLIDFLKKELNIDYRYYELQDCYNTTADLLIKKDSSIFNEFISGKDTLEFNIEELIDQNKFDNKDEIIIIDIQKSEYLMSLKYLCISLDYHELSYSNELKEKLAIFIDQVLSKSFRDIKK